MDKNTSLPVVKFSQLREDKAKKTEDDRFWENVPREEGGYILTDRVKGV